MAHKTNNGVVQVFDITTFLWHARCFAVLIRPFLNFMHLLIDIIRWKYPKLTFVLWLIVNIFSSVIPAEYIFIIFAIAFGLICALGMLHHYTQIFIKLFPDRELELSALQTYLQRNWGDEQKILEEYRRVLLKMDSLIETLNSSLESIYVILKWEQPLISASLASVALITVILLCFADLRISIFFGNNIILLGSGIYLYKQQNKHKFYQENLVEKKEECPAEGTLRLVNDANENEDSDVEEGEAEEQDSSESLDTKAIEELDMGKSRTNVVRKLMDLRKRHHQSNAGVCTGCHSTFLSILKRKYYCCNCGNQFCSRCCNLRVPKSFLGVTVWQLRSSVFLNDFSNQQLYFVTVTIIAPSTKNDTVPLCGICHQHLMAKSTP